MNSFNAFDSLFDSSFATRTPLLGVGIFMGITFAVLAAVMALAVSSADGILEGSCGKFGGAGLASEDAISFCVEFKIFFETHEERSVQLFVRIL